MGGSLNTNARAVRYWLIAAAIVIYGVGISLLHFYYFDPQTRPGSTLFDLGFDFGPAIKSILATKSYTECLPPHYYGSYGDFCMVASRMPIVPLFLVMMSFFSLSTLPALIVKNIVTFGLMALAVMRHSSFESMVSSKFQWRAVPSNPKALLLLAFVFAAFFVPYNAFINSTLDFEEGYFMGPLLVAMAVLFDIGKRREHIILGLLLAVMIYVKASMWPIALILAVMAMIFSARNEPWLRRGAPLLILLAAYFAWGGFVYEKTGHFAYGATMSSGAGGQLYRGNNPYIIKLYPKYSVDYPFQSGMVKVDRKFKDEWEGNAYFSAKAKEFIADHPDEFVELALKKAYVVLFNVRDNARAYTPDAKEKINPSLVIDRLLLYGAILTCLVLTYRQKVWWGPFIVTVLAAGAYCAPLVVGYAYNRHVIPFVLMVLFCTAWIPRDQPQNATS